MIVVLLIFLLSVFLIVILKKRTRSYVNSDSYYNVESSGENKQKKASLLVSSAVLGMDFKTVLVNNKTYIILPPTIKKIAGAGYYLSEIKDAESIRDVLLTLSTDSAAHALSWLIGGNDDLFEELKEGSYDEIVSALELGYSLISTENFFKLSSLARNVANLIAKQKQ